jgi:hypothetical protein
MNTLFTTPITSQSDAESFIFDLVQQGLSFHPEDDANDIIRSSTGQRLFSPKDAECVNQRREELFQYLDDPCSVLLETLERWR